LRSIWLPVLDAFRTLVVAPSAETRAIFDAIRRLAA
jgi:hypothetical protein